MARTSNYQGGDAVTLTGLYGALGGILERNYQQAQEKAQAEQQRADKLYDEVQKLATKVNPSGILPDDYDDFMSIYQNGIKKNMIDAMLARQNGDMKTYTAKISKANEEIANANYLIGRSKGRMEDYSKFFLNFKPEDFPDEAPEELARLMSIPTLKLKPTDTLIGNPVFMRKVDTSKVQGQIDSVLDDLFKTSGKLSDINPTRVMAGGRGADVLQFEEAIDKDVFAESVKMRFSSDPAWRAFAKQNNLGDTPEEAAINLTAAYEAAGRFQREDGRQIVRDQALSQTGGGKEPAGVGDLVTGLDITYGPNDAVIRAPRYVGLQSTNVPLAGTPAINLTTGTRVAQIPESITDTRIVALAEIPVGATDAYRGMPITRNMAERFPNAVTPKEVLIVQGKVKRGSRERVERYAIDRNALPTNLSNNNEVQAAIVKFDQGAVQSPQNSVPLTDNSTKPKLSW